MSITFPVQMGGETITADMVRGVATECEVVDTQPGPLGLALGEKPTNGPRMERTGLVTHTLTLKDGRTVVAYGTL